MDRGKCTADDGRGRQPIPRCLIASLWKIIRKRLVISSLTWTENRINLDVIVQEWRRILYP